MFVFSVLEPECDNAVKNHSIDCQMAYWKCSENGTSAPINLSPEVVDEYSGYTLRLPL